MVLEEEVTSPFRVGEKRVITNIWGSRPKCQIRADEDVQIWTGPGVPQNTSADSQQ